MREGNSAEESTKRNYRRKGEGRKMWGLNVKKRGGSKIIRHVCCNVIKAPTMSNKCVIHLGCFSLGKHRKNTPKTKNTLKDFPGHARLYPKSQVGQNRKPC